MAAACTMRHGHKHAESVTCVPRYKKGMLGYKHEVCGGMKQTPDQVHTVQPLKTFLRSEQYRTRIV